MQRQDAGKLPTRFGFEKIILCVAPRPRDNDDILISYSDTITRDDESSWIEAMKLELESLWKLNTWEHVPQPENGNVVQSK